MLSEEMREYLFRLSENQPVTMPEAGWPDEVAQLEADHKFVIERENKIMVEFEKLVRYVRARIEMAKLKAVSRGDNPENWLRHIAPIEAEPYQALSDETRKAIEDD